MIENHTNHQLGVYFIYINRYEITIDSVCYENLYICTNVPEEQFMKGLITWKCVSMIEIDMWLIIRQSFNIDLVTYDIFVIWAN